MSGAVWEVTVTSLMVSGSATLLAMLIGLPLASICARGNFAAKPILKVGVRTLYGLTTERNTSSKALKEPLIHPITILQVLKTEL